jgi:hypothetical protein
MGAHEDEIKAAVARELQRGCPEAITLYEVGLSQGRVRADIVSLSPICFRAIEVKSEADSLRRLPEQVRVYSQVADACTLVVAERHHAKLREAFTGGACAIPPWWDIWTYAAGSVDLAWAGRPNPAPDALGAARLLWRDEAMDALRGLGRAKGLSRKGIHWLHQALVDTLPQDELRSLVRRQLLARKDWTRLPAKKEAAVAGRDADCVTSRDRTCLRRGRSDAQGR